MNLDRFRPFLEDGRATKDRIAAITEDAVTLTSGKTVTREQLGLAPIMTPVDLVTEGPIEFIGKRCSELLKAQKAQAGRSA